ncbi:hypothetical protein L596_013620 [Steinernema carpocapsae]|uniref:Uncharacterized protein n=1 Tax=Steinernema carpocapsae TaxID=34508 RepID=A0A4U5P0Q9_STECR|nr:hypothetical protein L596_013618 [Steinernema carpocapsae]TKR89531.1 hypothetical protein L596_013620 [Steinernema carpocapsae]
MLADLFDTKDPLEESMDCDGLDVSASEQSCAVNMAMEDQPSSSADRFEVDQVSSDIEDMNLEDDGHTKSNNQDVIHAPINDTRMDRPDIATLALTETTGLLIYTENGCLCHECDPLYYSESNPMDISRMSL